MTGPPTDRRLANFKTAWVTLSTAEARDLLLALQFWSQDVAEGESDPGWHKHITDEAGNELTVAIEPAERT